ncbi:hypothetical protein [Paraburkholderia phosphatilytica]|uniref:hypothetical protein n=1 Tax=Paraburkholderia phosphatilytica TaxID=2282883 RepID=UPI000E4AE18B|nr:hypothetical protein [Paraburkholderia phosphatilytica]
MKPFNLEEAKAGKPIITRDGRTARFLAHIPEASEALQVFAIVDGEKAATPLYTSGLFYETGGDHDHDLFMAPEKSTVYLNVYAVNMKTRHAFESCAFKVEADAKHDASINGARLLAVAVPVEIEV